MKLAAVICLNMNSAPVSCCRSAMIPHDAPRSQCHYDAAAHPCLPASSPRHISTSPPLPTPALTPPLSSHPVLASSSSVCSQDVLDQAAAIRELRERMTRPLPTYPEPKRTKVHWDFLLEEMEWMAKEFSRERGWKLKQNKRFAKMVQRHKESSAEMKIKEEEQSIRRKATTMAKQVRPGGCGGCNVCSCSQ